MSPSICSKAPASMPFHRVDRDIDIVVHRRGLCVYGMSRIGPASALLCKTHCSRVDCRRQAGTPRPPASARGRAKWFLPARDTQTHLICMRSSGPRALPRARTSANMRKGQKSPRQLCAVFSMAPDPPKPPVLPHAPLLMFVARTVLHP